MTAPAGETRGRPFTAADLEAMPGDGRRRELVDGMLLVAPAPEFRHEEVVSALADRLSEVRPGDLCVRAATAFVRASASTVLHVLQPDVLVGRGEDFVGAVLPVVPLLAVEVLSPCTALIDLHLKKAAYERMGVRSYWIIDPREPKLAVFELDAEGRYELVAEVKGDDPFDAVRPFPVRIVPAALLGSLKD